ncbi:MAG: helix-turn-helix domain-containing protein, partial [Candidatus Bathyarchaeia archaeon]
MVKKVKPAGVLETLRTLGLAQYEAKAYLCLVENGLSNAGDISKLAEIPY